MLSPGEGCWVELTLFFLAIDRLGLGLTGRLSFFGHSVALDLCVADRQYT